MDQNIKFELMQNIAVKMKREDPIIEQVKSHINAMNVHKVLE